MRIQAGEFYKISHQTGSISSLSDSSFILLLEIVQSILRQVQQCVGEHKDNLLISVRLINILY